MNKVYLIFPIMTLLGALGGFYFKKASSILNFKKLSTIFFNYHLYLGGIFYVTAAVLNIVVLKFLPYSIVLPLTAITYIWTMILSKFALNEKITNNKIIGVILIILGCVLIAM